MVIIESKDFFKCEACDLLVSDNFKICPRCNSKKEMKNIFMQYRYNFNDRAINIAKIENIVAANAFNKNKVKAIDFQIDVVTDNEELNSEYPFITVWVEDKKIESPIYIALYTREAGEIDYKINESEKQICIEKIKEYVFNEGWSNI